MSCLPLLYAGAFGLMLTSHQYSFFVGSMGVLTFGEMFIGRMLGPVFGGLLYDHFAFPTVVIVTIAVLALPVLSIAVYARTRRERGVPSSRAKNRL